MLLTDKLIAKKCQSIISPFEIQNIGNVHYELIADSFSNEKKNAETSIVLHPMESTFVKSKEVVQLPNNMIAFVQLKNSRIREGLTLNAPIYQPGHKTNVFYRITNISQQDISLKSEDKIAQILFYELSQDVENPYSGTFQSEFEYTGMGKYTEEYSKDMKRIEDKYNDVKNIESRIYTNVLSILAIFVSVFSLININVSSFSQSLDIKNIVILNSVLIGSLGFLIAIIQNVINSDKGKKINIFIWIPSAIAFVVSIILTII